MPDDNANAAAAVKIMMKRGDITVAGQSASAAGTAENEVGVTEEDGR